MKSKLLLCTLGLALLLSAGCAQPNQPAGSQPNQPAGAQSAGAQPNQSAAPQPAGAQPSQSAAPPKSPEAGADLPGQTAASDPAAYIGEEEARRAALEHAGLEESQIALERCVLELDGGRWEYDVEFYTGDYREYDYEIDACTGAVISYDYDAEYLAPSDGSGAVTAEQARQLALAQVPGAAEGDIREFEADRDGGMLLYEGKILYNGMEYEFEIDAGSGALLSWEQEPLHG